jgi:rRNA-processing protein EBP2
VAVHFDSATLSAFSWMAKNNPLAANQAEKATPSKGPVDDNIDDNSSDDGVDEAGMKRLMELLGDDGLDELGAAQLKILAESGIDNDASDAGDDGASENGDDPGGPQSDESGENGEDEDGIRTGSSEDEREEEAASHNEDGEKEEFVALDDASSVDEDAVPRQKIVINNTVRADICSGPVTIPKNIAFRSHYNVSVQL